MLPCTSCCREDDCSVVRGVTTTAVTRGRVVLSGRGGCGRGIVRQRSTTCLFGMGGRGGSPQEALVASHSRLLVDKNAGTIANTTIAVVVADD